MAPKRETKIAINVKELTSKNVDKPIGTPIRKCVHNAFISGQYQRFARMES